MGHLRVNSQERAKFAAVVGAKAVNLGILQGTFPVPRGFVVTPAYERERDLGLLVDAYYKLRAPNVAVRSSATAEDTPHESFAGMYQSFMPVEGLDSLAAHIEKVRASLQRPAPTDYMKRAGINPESVRMAVIVQQYIEARISGILFGAHVASGDTNYMTLGAHYGVGEKLASGRVTWQDIIIEKATLKASHPSVRHELTGDDYVLLDELEHKFNLFEVYKRIEKLFGKPQDVEFVVGRDGLLYITQSRDVTTLKAA